MRLAAVAIVLGCGSKAPAPTPVTEPKPVDTTPVSEPSKAPPLERGTKLSCERLVDAAAFIKALGESDPLSVRDDSKRDAEAAAVCSLVRGGQPLSKAEQDKRLKQTGRIGVLPGDVLCEVSAYCWTYEDRAHAEQQCGARGGSIDKAGDSFACLQLVAAGANDIAVFHVLDDDTGCVLKISGGPANVDNDSIRACANTASATIGPRQIK